MLAELKKKPGAGHGPLALNGSGGDTEDLGGLLDGESAEEAHGDNLFLARVEGAEFLESVVDSGESSRALGVEDEDLVEGDEVVFAATLGGEPGAGVIDEDSAHELAGDGKEVGAIGEVGFTLLDELEICLVDKGGGLEGMAGALLAHGAHRATPQLVVDERHEALDDSPVTVRETI